MSLDEKFVPVQNMWYDFVRKFVETIAKLFGYPNPPGMPYEFDGTDPRSSQFEWLVSLPRHKTFWPPLQRPTTLFEMVFGATPKPDIIPKYFYESKEEGFYNFYIENYRNIYFLPDWFSEFLQVKLQICLDLSVLETIRETLFLAFFVYAQIVILRITLSWLIYINPYRFPWSYLAGAVDWTEDAFLGLVPSILGVNFTGTIFLGVLGVFADALNHLVFTMPFLPSEAEQTKLLIHQQLKDVLVFHYLPILWYRHPIPNDLREFWYYQRPDILTYLQSMYQELNIQFLPDAILESLHQ
jgi:hypothetical protein